MINFLHTFLPQPILFQWGFIAIYWYGVFVVAGIFVGWFLILKLARYFGINANQVINLVFYLVIFGLVGARLYAIILDWPYYFSHPGEMIAVWHGGLAIHGAIIGGLVTLIIYSHRKKPASPDAEFKRASQGGQSFWQWADILAVGLPLAQAIGRWGNYFNQEVFGSPTSLPWGIPIQIQNRPAEYLAEPYFHPTFLYESVLDGLNFVILIFLFYFFYYSKQCHPELDSGSHKSGTLKQVQSDKAGIIFLIYLINYSVIRIGMEFLRLDPTPTVFGLRWPILVSSLVIMVSFGFLFFKKSQKELKKRI